jgi:hypothetical protein
MTDNLNRSGARLRLVPLRISGVGVYVRNLLDWGDTLSSELLRLDFNDGIMECLLPAGLVINDVNSLSSPIEAPSWSSNDVDVLLIDIIATDLHKRENGLLLVGSFAYERDLEFRPSNVPYVLVPRWGSTDRSVWYYTTTECATSDSLVACFENERFPSVAVLTSPPPGGRIAQRLVLDEEDSRSLANRTERIIVSAFDGDTRAIWSRSTTMVHSPP